MALQLPSEVDPRWPPACRRARVVWEHETLPSARQQKRSRQDAVSAAVAAIDRELAEVERHQDGRVARRLRPAERDAAFAAPHVVGEVQEEEVEPHAGPITQLMLGRPLETAAMPHQTIGKAIGLAVF